MIVKPGENFSEILDAMEKVRKKDLVYTIFNFANRDGTKYNICRRYENPHIHNRFSVKNEEELKSIVSEFRNDVEKHGCCYALFDFETNMEDGSSRSLLCLVTLIPDTYSTQEKFLYSVHQSTFVNSFGPVKLFQFSSSDEITYEKFRESCLALKRG